MANIYPGTINLRIILDLQEEVTGATGVTFEFLRPNNTTQSRTPTVSGTTIYYDTVVGDFTVPGRYSLQAALTLAGWVGRSETVEIIVSENYN